MKPSSMVLIAGVIVFAGTWANKKDIRPTVVVGMFLTAFFVSIIADSNEKIGRAFAVLILVVATLTYAAPILANLAKAEPK